MSDILCLANSPKEKARCIAGIELQTGRFVRPVSQTESQAIPEDWAVLDGRSIQPLDVIDIPLIRGDAVVPFQQENRYCKEGWKRTDRLRASDVRRFCESDFTLLGTADSEAIPERLLKLKHHGRSGWKSLQLVYARSVEFHHMDGKWMGTFQTGNSRDYELRVTDENFTQSLNNSANRECILLLSLTRPWRHYLAPKSEPKKCYKLIAGVLPL